MARQLFGTDGVRGVAGEPPLDRATVSALGSALGKDLQEHGRDGAKPVVLIGMDTRESGLWIAEAVAGGLREQGVDARFAGVITTPGVAYLTRTGGFAAGVMISASHNPIEDNGIKFFGADGFKLSDAVEDEIGEQLNHPDLPRPTHVGVGIASLQHGLAERYTQMVVAAGVPLTGWTVVVDAAFGAAYEIGPVIFERLGARVIAINAADDGGRINVGCGATDLAMLAAAVRAEIARGNGRCVGVAFDGDADRAKFVDETGALLDGDHALLILARDRRERGTLPGNAVVATVMSNVGLERALEIAQIAMLRAPVGDRYVLEAMRAGGYRLGGEQSGHVIDLDRNTTGDGPMTAVTLFAVAARAGVRLHDLASSLTVFPQILINVRVEDRGIAEAPAVLAAVAAAEARLGAAGRILVRPSGTEPLVRVMVEAADLRTTEEVAEAVASVIRDAAASSRAET